MLTEKSHRYASRMLGAVVLSCGVFGLWFNVGFVAVEMPASVDHYAKYIAVAFLTIWTIIYVFLIYLGIGFLRLDVAAAPLLTKTCVVELLIAFGLIPLGLLVPAVGTGAGASAGCLPQLILLIPVWAPFLGHWLKQQSEAAPQSQHDTVYADPEEHIEKSTDWIIVVIAYIIICFVLYFMFVMSTAFVLTLSMKGNLSAAAMSSMFITCLLIMLLLGPVLIPRAVRRVRQNRKRRCHQIKAERLLAGRCPICAYDLTGLEGRRCPECGYKSGTVSE